MSGIFKTAVYPHFHAAGDTGDSRPTRLYFPNQQVYTHRRGNARAMLQFTYGEALVDLDNAGIRRPRDIQMAVSDGDRGDWPVCTVAGCFSLSALRPNLTAHPPGLSDFCEQRHGLHRNRPTRPDAGRSTVSAIADRLPA